MTATTATVVYSSDSRQVRVLDPIARVAAASRIARERQARDARAARLARDFQRDYAGHVVMLEEDGVMGRYWSAYDMRDADRADAGGAHYARLVVHGELSDLDCSADCPSPECVARRAEWEAILAR